MNWHPWKQNNFEVRNSKINPPIPRPAGGQDSNGARSCWWSICLHTKIRSPLGLKQWCEVHDYKHSKSAYSFQCGTFATASDLSNASYPQSQHSIWIHTGEIHSNVCDQLLILLSLRRSRHHSSRSRGWNVQMKFEAKWPWTDRLSSPLTLTPRT